MIPTFDVPEQYFYALAAGLPQDVSADVRYRVATSLEEKQIVDQLRRAIDAGFIDADPTVTPEQAARRLRALGSVQGASPVCASGVGLALTSAYVNYKSATPADDYDPAADIAPFWNGVMGNPALAAAHLELSMCAVTQDADSRNFIQHVKTAAGAYPGHVLATVMDLDPTPWIGAVPPPPIPPPAHGITDDDWKAFFAAYPADLPEITKPGTNTERIGAFIRRLKKFFDVAAGTPAGPSAATEGPPELGIPNFDAIGAFLGIYGHTFPFAAPFDPTDPAVRAALDSVFPDDPRARVWLARAIGIIDDLYRATDVVGSNDALHFSLIEALYSRGFTRTGDITVLSQDDFHDALIGTIAEGLANAIWSHVGGGGGYTPSPGPFHPINDGSLTDCIPPPERSPLGPIAYLHDLLRLRTDATCDRDAPADPEAKTLGELVTGRRGAIGDLHASRANVAVPLPVIDLVNECLEHLVSPSGGPGGVVYDTTDGPYRHDPSVLFAALPEHSSPAVPVALPDAYTKLSTDFSAPILPYDQPLDVDRTYLGALGTTRFSVMRHFCRDITEFVLDPGSSGPADFQKQLWRYPVRIDVAREYLHISPEEYDLFFTKTPDDTLLATLFGYGGDDGDRIFIVSELLARTGLSYCEFLDLWRSGFVKFQRGSSGNRENDPNFPLCEPCYLDKVRIRLDAATDEKTALVRFAIFIRLWKKLQDVPHAKYSFSELAKIADVLGLFQSDGTVNPDFIRQLAAFQMLRDDFHFDGLVLWKGTSDPGWERAVAQLLQHIEHHARTKHACAARGPEFLKVLADNLDPLARLAGFDDTKPERTWHFVPTHTLRFAEVLSKIYASDFTVGELLYLLTADDELAGDDPFPLGEDDEAIEDPLDFPDEVADFSLWRLRQKLLDVRVEDDAHWTWPRIEASMREDFGYVPAADDPLAALGAHFFPGVLERSGTTVAASSRQYRKHLPATSAAMWNTPPDGPFHYDTAASDLWIELPLRDEAVLTKLGRIRPLSALEGRAVQDLYYQPRAALVQFGFLFPNFAKAERHLIEEPNEEARWEYFRRHFARAHARAKVIAQHLAAHVDAVVGCQGKHDEQLASRLLRDLLADENKSRSPWGADDGERPDVTWGPSPNGGAFAALFGLVGTGLLGEIRVQDGKTVAWRELRAETAPFGHLRDALNVPVPMIVPSLQFALTADQSRYATIRNGIAFAGESGKRLGGVEPFCASWKGVLLVEESGTYRFWGGAPTPEGEKPDLEHVHGRKWRVTLKRGQKSWVLLHHGGEADGPSGCSAALSLKRGAYDLAIEFEQCAPTLDDFEDARPSHTGFQLKYEGTDTGDRIVTIPLHRLYVQKKDAPLAELGDGAPDAALSFLHARYFSTLRDVRRTYQRAFKALLFATRFELSAHPFADYGQSEIGYFLEHHDNFGGLAFYGSPGSWTTHRATFDFNLLPLKDIYFPPPSSPPPNPIPDDRVVPSLARKQALFDIWERVFDYTRLRRDVHAKPVHPLWLLFDEAAEEDPTKAAGPHLLRHLHIDFAHEALLFTYAPSYTVTYGDLADERWAIRVWRADELVERMVKHFLFADLSKAKPSLWAGDDLAAGNANLAPVIREGFIENGPPGLGVIAGQPPHRYQDLQRLNDGLRERARRALLAYLCGPSGIASEPKKLTEWLLLDVEVGICEKASRVEEAITAIQTFVQRARLGLEGAWVPASEFISLWERRFETYRIWQACERRVLYRENWIEWEALEEARKTEAFRFLEDRLRRSTLTVPVPGGLEYWTGERPPARPALLLLQERDPSSMVQIPKPREGLNLLGTPERGAQRSWLAPVQSTFINGGGNGNGNDNPSTEPRGRGHADPTNPPGGFGKGKLPLWLEAAIRLGTRFVRVAAGGIPPASTRFEAHGHFEDCCAPMCQECGRVHEVNVDEYYFWLADSRWYSEVVQNAGEANDAWHDPTKLPGLLLWPSKPMVHLMWCRIHDGEIRQPRRSMEGVRLIDAVAPADVQIEFEGRTRDSLLFQVVRDGSPGANVGKAPDGYAATPLPGFRYDLAADSAAVVPEVLPAAPSAKSVGGLAAYPYFVYVAPGAPLLPQTPHAESVAVATTLRAHCRFEAALKWYAFTFDPLRSDVRWCPRHPNDNRTPSEGDPIEDRTLCCKHAGLPRGEQGDRIARNRSLTLDYLETLLDWGDCLMKGHTPEAFQKARLVFDTAEKILGPAPHIVENHDSAGPSPMTAFAFVPDGAPINPRLMSLYERFADRLALIHHCLNGRRLRNGRPNEDMPYFGYDAARDGWKTAVNACCNEDPCCCPPSPYRFVHLVQKAVELAVEAQKLGASLEAAYEKGDAEYLAYVRAGHEHQILSLARSIRENQWRDADWQVQALRKTKEIAQTNRRYYATLLALGLNSGELDHQALVNAQIGSITAATVTEAVATVLGIIPDVWVGTCSNVQLPVGTKLAKVFEGIARISMEVGQILGTTAGLRLTQSGWVRRDDEWRHQVEIYDLEIEQVERQILGAERRRDVALRELESQTRQIENCREVLEVLRDKFTSHQLYLWLQKETAALYYRMYELARCAALSAERAFNLERGHTTRKFVPEDAWDDLHAGLLAGERLGLAVRRMEKAYTDENVREYELTKHISLRMHFARAFLALKLTGQCVIELPEWLFDLDYPGHYMRRIKNVSLTLPCVVGPYTGVHARLTLLSSTTRIDPRLHGPVAPCCKDDAPKPPPPPTCGCFPAPRPVKHISPSAAAVNGYTQVPDDPRVVKQYAAVEAIATSSGQNDAGLFELNFRDERYLPFEFAGAVSRWRIELPPENNYFDIDSLTDVILHLNYTAREGGDVLRAAAKEAAQARIPDDGRRVFDLKREFPDEWRKFQAERGARRRRFDLRLSRDLFPFLPGHRDLWIARVEVLAAARGAEASTHREIELVVGHEEGCAREGEEYEFQATGGAAWPGIFHGAVDVQVGPLPKAEARRIGTLHFEERIEGTSDIFLIVHYVVR